MKIFVAHSSNFDFVNGLYLPLRNSPLNLVHEIFLPQEGEHQEVTKELIKAQELILAEVSCPSTGEGIELGWASIFEIPIICVYKTGYKYSTSIENVTKQIVEYKDNNDLISKLETIISSY